MEQKEPNLAEIRSAAMYKTDGEWKLNNQQIVSLIHAILTELNIPIDKALQTADTIHEQLYDKNVKQLSALEREKQKQQELIKEKCRRIINMNAVAMSVDGMETYDWKFQFTDRYNPNEKSPTIEEIVNEQFVYIDKKVLSNPEAYANELIQRLDKKPEFSHMFKHEKRLTPYLTIEQGANIPHNDENEQNYKVEFILRSANFPPKV